MDRRILHAKVYTIVFVTLTAFVLASVDPQCSARYVLLVDVSRPAAPYLPFVYSLLDHFRSEATALSRKHGTIEIAITFFGTCPAGDCKIWKPLSYLEYKDILNFNEPAMLISQKEEIAKKYKLLEQGIPKTGPALDHALSLLKEQRETNGIPASNMAVILVTGRNPAALRPTGGLDTTDRAMKLMRSAARNIKDAGITLYTILVGDEMNKSLMNECATPGKDYDVADLRNEARIKNAFSLDALCSPSTTTDLRSNRNKLPTSGATETAGSTGSSSTSSTDMPERCTSDRPPIDGITTSPATPPPSFLGWLIALFVGFVVVAVATIVAYASVKAEKSKTRGEGTVGGNTSDKEVAVDIENNDEVSE